MGLHQDREKGVELWLQAGELGCAASFYSIAEAYYKGNGIKRGTKKAKESYCKHYCELAAMRGNVKAMHSLGCIEGDAGNLDRAMKHFMISAGAGHDYSLENIKRGFMHGLATKDDFDKALRSHKQVKDE